MANVIYKLSTKVDKISGKREIYVRFYHGRFDFRAKTNLYVLPEYWDVEKQSIKVPNTRSNTVEKQKLIIELSSLKAELEKLSRDIREAFITEGGGKKDLPIEWLSDFLTKRIVEKDEKKESSNQAVEDESEATSGQQFFFDTFRYFVSIQKVSISRIRHYNVIMRALQRFAIYNAEDISFETFTADTLREYASFLETEHSFVKTGEDGKPCIEDPLYLKAYESVPECRYPKPRGQNAIIGSMSRLHTFFRWAFKKGYIAKDPFDDYVIGTAVYGTPFYLTKPALSSRFSEASGAGCSERYLCVPMLCWLPGGRLDETHQEEYCQRSHRVCSAEDEGRSSIYRPGPSFSYGKGDSRSLQRYSWRAPASFHLRARLQSRYKEDDTPCGHRPDCNHIEFGYERGRETSYLGSCILAHGSSCSCW